MVVQIFQLFFSSSIFTLLTRFPFKSKVFIRSIFPPPKLSSTDQITVCAGKMHLNGIYRAMFRETESRFYKK